MRTEGRGIRKPTIALVGACALMAIAKGPVLNGQPPSVSGQVHYKTGQNVAPVYEGWYSTPDGATHVSFGYLNKNYEEALDIPVGPSNRIEPGPIDQGQPTHFLPRRQYGMFVVRLPKDHPKTEVTWTLSIRGRTESIPANLSDLYMIDALKQIGGTTEGTVPPGLRFDPSSAPAVGPAGITTRLEAAAARPLPLTVWLADQTSDASPRSRPEASSPLTVIWSKYRGAGEARFDNLRPPVEQGKASTTVTFPEPGEYVLRVAALRGSGFRGQCCWTNGYVHVKVGPGGDKR